MEATNTLSAIIKALDATINANRGEQECQLLAKLLRGLNKETEEGMCFAIGTAYKAGFIWNGSTWDF